MLSSAINCPAVHSSNGASGLGFGAPVTERCRHSSISAAAARLAPDQARYRAYYGRALAAHPQTKRLAEAELQAAVKLDPANATYRVMLAALYSDLGFGRRAISELERALSLDANNAEARRMLESLEAKK